MKLNSFIAVAGRAILLVSGVVVMASSLVLAHVDSQTQVQKREHERGDAAAFTEPRQAAALVAPGDKLSRLREFRSAITALQ